MQFLVPSVYDETYSPAQKRIYAYSDIEGTSEASNLHVGLRTVSFPIFGVNLESNLPIWVINLSVENISEGVLAWKFPLAALCKHQVHLYSFTPSSLT
jgi:hypothetical protein